MKNKRKTLQKAFVVTFAQASATFAIPACVTNPPEVPAPLCDSTAPFEGSSCYTVATCSYSLDDGCHVADVTYSCNGSVWSVERPTDTSPCNASMKCSDRPAAAGAGCSEARTCAYWYDKGCGPQVDIVACGQGIWFTRESQIPCSAPTPPDCPALTIQADCEMNAECRWLEPGTDMPTVAQAGCFAKRDCLGNLDCPHVADTCQSVNIACADPAACPVVALCLPKNP